MKMRSWLSLGVLALATTSLAFAAEPAKKSEDHETYRYAGGLVKLMSEVKPPAPPAPAVKLVAATVSAPVHKVEPACDDTIHAMYRWNSGIIRHIEAKLPPPPAPAAPAVQVQVTVKDAPAEKAAPAKAKPAARKMLAPVKLKLRK